MFTSVLLNFYYRVIKSGLLFDFLFKRVVHAFLSFNFIIFNILLSEKYFVEQLFVKGLTTAKWLWRSLNLYTNEFTLSNLSVLLVVFIGFIIFINGKFT